MAAITGSKPNNEFVKIEKKYAHTESQTDEKKLSFRFRFLFCDYLFNMRLYNIQFFWCSFRFFTYDASLLIFSNVLRNFRRRIRLKKVPNLNRRQKTAAAWRFWRDKNESVDDDTLRFT